MTRPSKAREDLQRLGEELRQHEEEDRRIKEVGQRRAETLEDQTPDGLERAAVEINREADAIRQEREKLTTRIREIEAAAQAARTRAGDLRIHAMQAGGDRDGLLAHVLRNYEDGGPLAKKVWKEFQEEAGIGGDGYNAHTKERFLQIAMTQGDEEGVAKVVAGLRRAIPLLKPSTEEGEVQISILEEDLSAEGAHRLKVMPNLSAARVTVERWGHEREMKRFGGLEAAVSWIAENLYYRPASRSPRR